MNAYADFVIFSNSIHTIADPTPISGGVAVRGNFIEKVASRAEIEQLVGPQTQVYDVGDQMVMPGFIEGHTHIDGPLFLATRVNLIGVTSEQECVSLTKKWADEHPEDEWVFGFGWCAANWNGAPEPTKASLDAVIPDRPVFLQDIGCHAGWLNTAGLKKLGIGRDEMDLEARFGYDGKIRYDSDGEPIGYIQDGPVLAMMDEFQKSISGNIPDFLERSLHLFAEKGVTAINDMWLYQDDSLYVKGLNQLLQEDRLPARVFFQYHLLLNDVSHVAEVKQTYQTDKLRLVGLKAIADSVWCDRSAYNLREYKGTPGNHGNLYLNRETWGPKIAEGNRLGLPTHLHSSGNGTVRAALDVYEEALQINGPGDYRNTIEHCDTIHPDDIPRFAKLGVLANVTPDFMYKTNCWKDSPVHTVYDEETAKWCWPFASLLASGAVVTFGCDAPASTCDPLTQLFRAATRVMEDGEPKGGFLPHEKVSVTEGLRCYTYNAAYEAHMEDKLGTLESGKLADIIVIDQDITKMDPLEIRTANVVMTFVNGRLVYQK